MPDSSDPLDGWTNMRLQRQLDPRRTIHMGVFMYMSREPYCDSVKAFVDSRSSFT